MSTVETESPQRCAGRQFKFRDAVLSDVGRRRSENQDSYGIAHTEQTSLYVVADGMGGARGGATASMIAVNAIVKKAVKEDGTVDPDSLKSAIEISNKAIFLHSKNDGELSGMGTTVVALAFVEEYAIVAHVGDSRIYHLRNKELTQLTRDHTLVQELVDASAIAPEDAASHPIAHMLTRSLGPAEMVEVELNTLEQPLQAGDRFLLCSDGLYNLVTAEEIEDILSREELADVVKTLVDLALERGGTDNVTVEVLEAFDVNDESLVVEYPAAGDVALDISSEGTSEDIKELLDTLDDVNQRLEEVLKAEEEEESITNTLMDGEFSLSIDSSPSSDQEQTVSESIGVEEVLGEEEEISEKEEYQGLTPDLDVCLEEESSGEEVAEIELDEVGAELEEDFSDADAAPTVMSENAPIDAWKLRLGASAVMIVGLLTVAYAVQTYKSVKDNSPRPIPKMEIEDGRDAGLDEFEQEPDRDPEDTQDAVQDPQYALTEKDDGSQETSTPAATEDSIETGHEQGASSTALEQVTDDVNDLSVPEEGPNIDAATPPVDSEPPTQPIVWENEQDKVARVTKNPKESDSPASESREKSADELSLEKELELAAQEKTPSSNRTAGILSPREMRTHISKKKDLREQIADIDMKLKSLNLDTKEKASKSKALLESKLATATKASKIVKIKLRKTGKEIQKWKTLRAQAEDEQIFELAKTVAELRPRTAGKLKSYFETNEKYSLAFEKWQEDPTKIELASQMGAIARKLESMEVGLAQLIDDTIARELKRTNRRRGEHKVTLDRLEARRAQINRHIGYLKGYTPLVSERRIELRDLYLEKRERALLELKELRKLVSDQKEEEFSQKHLK